MNKRLSETKGIVIAAKMMGSLTETIESFLDGVAIRVSFENGYGASVVQHRSSYGSEDGLWELAVILNGEIDYDNEVAEGDVLGFLSLEEVIDALLRICNLPRPNCLDVLDTDGDIETLS